jgi:opacity protein-like surface antigen
MAKRTLTKLIIASVASVMGTAAYSAPQWYLTYGGGIVRPYINSHTLVNNNSGSAPPFNNDTYTSHNSNAPALLLETGKRWEISGSVIKALLIGLQYQHVFATDIGKNIYQYSSPEYLNYTYQLDLEANKLLINSKVELFSWKRFTPFVNLGAGYLQLISSDYNEYALSGVTARTSPNFQNDITYRLTYQVGGGFNWQLNKSLIASINYIYQPLTRFETKGGKGVWSNRKLNFGGVSANSIFITLTTYLP